MLLDFDRREGAERLLFFFLREVFLSGFQWVAGAKPRSGAGGFTATDLPDSPINSPEEPSGDPGLEIGPIAPPNPPPPLYSERI